MDYEFGGLRRGGWGGSKAVSKRNAPNIDTPGAKDGKRGTFTPIPGLKQEEVHGEQVGSWGADAATDEPVFSCNTYRYEGRKGSKGGLAWAYKMAGACLQDV